MVSARPSKAGTRLLYSEATRARVKVVCIVNTPLFDLLVTSARALQLLAGDQHVFGVANVRDLYAYRFQFNAHNTEVFPAHRQMAGLCKLRSFGPLFCFV